MKMGKSGNGNENRNGNWKKAEVGMEVEINLHNWPSYPMLRFGFLMPISPAVILNISSTDTYFHLNPETKKRNFYYLLFIKMCKQKI